MHTIYFKKQAEGKWRRDEDENHKLVDEKTFKREVERRIKQGYKVDLHGSRLQLRGVTLSKEI